jgi:hypothetical protein
MGESDYLWFGLQHGLFMKLAKTEKRDNEPGESGAGICVRYSSSNKSQGYWTSPEGEDDEPDDQKEIHVSDAARAAYLRSLLTPEGMKTATEGCSCIDTHLAVQDPRFMHWILDLEETPVGAKQRILDVLAFADECLKKLRAPLYTPALPAVFHTCLVWCVQQCEVWAEEGITCEVPTMDRLVDSLVEHVVSDFDLGCDQYISRDVLFGRGAGTGWDDLKVCFCCQKYVAYLACEVPRDEWPDN